MRILDEAYMNGLFATGGDVEGNTIADRVAQHMIDRCDPPSDVGENEMFMDLNDMLQRLPPEERVKVFRAVIQYGAMRAAE